MHKPEPGAFRVPEVLNWFNLLAFPHLEVGNLTFFDCFELIAVGVSKSTCCLVAGTTRQHVVYVKMYCIYWKGWSILSLSDEMEQPITFSMESCKSCSIYCGNKLLQCLLHFPLNPDPVTFFIWGFFQLKPLTPLSVSLLEVFQVAPREDSLSLFITDTYAKCNISHALIISSHAGTLFTIDHIPVV